MAMIYGFAAALTPVSATLYGPGGTIQTTTSHLTSHDGRWELSLQATETSPIDVYWDVLVTGAAAVAIDVPEGLGAVALTDCPAAAIDRANLQAGYAAQQPLTTEPVATGAAAVAIGESAVASHADAVALGADAVTTAASQIMLGSAAGGVVAPGALEVLPAGGGIVVKSPNGTRYLLGVSNAGLLSITAV